MSYLYEVKEKQAVILERWGRFKSVKTRPGMHIKGPFMRVATRVPLNITQHTIKLEETKTKDGIFVELPATLHLQVCDAKTFHYSAKSEQDPYSQVGDKILNAMKQLVNSMELDHIYEARETFDAAVREKVGATIEEMYGLKIVDVIIDQPTVPKAVQDAYNSAKASEQTAVATVNAANANKKAMIMDAEARKESLRLDGEGVAEQRSAMFKNLTAQFNELVQSGMPEDTAEKILIKMMELDTLRDVAKNGNVIVTTTADKDPITDMQAAVRAANTTKKPVPPAQP